ncbi:MAG TPA: nuclear transport factor 2 family protein [Micromonospora sp.]
MTDASASLSDILARLQRLEEIEAARNHLHAYAKTLDRPTPESVAALFTEDAVLSVPSGEFRGRDEIAAFYRSRIAAQTGDRRHFIMNLKTRHLGPGLVEIESYFIFTGRDRESSTIGWGTYRDRIRVTDGVPLFEAKTITPHVTTDLATGWAAPA